LLFFAKVYLIIHYHFYLKFSNKKYTIVKNRQEGFFSLLLKE